MPASMPVAFVGTSLIAVDEASVRDIPGLVAVVRIGDFVGVVAEREENAIKAAAQLKVTWKPVPTLARPRRTSRPHCAPIRRRRGR